MIQSIEKGRRREKRDSNARITDQHSGRTDGERSLFSDMLKGAIAGAVGVLALDAVTWALWDREDPRALQRERRARPGRLDPAHVIANRLAEALGTRLTPRQPHAAGIAAHYALGILPGAIYGALRKRAPVVGALGGAAFGLSLFLMQDEGLNPVLGTSGTPGEYPWQAHARGAVGHLVLGVVTDGTLGVLDRLLEPIPQH